MDKRLLEQQSWQRFLQAFMIYLSTAAFLSALEVLGECRRDEVSRSPVFQAIQQCRTQRGRRRADTVENESLLSLLRGHQGCLSIPHEINGSSLQQRLCSDPVAYVCGQTLGTGFYLDSQCHLVLNDQELANETPDVVAILCDLEEAEQRTLLSARRGPMARMSDPEVFQRSLRERIYTAERRQRLEQMFRRVKDAMVAAIRDSGRVRPDRREDLLRRVQSTNLSFRGVLDGGADPYSSCHNLGPNGLETDMFHSPGFGGAPGEIHICAGTMATLDLANPYQLMLSLGHELAHSIDPCVLEEDQWHRGGSVQLQGVRFQGAPYWGWQSFPGLMECLRSPMGPPQMNCIDVPVYQGDRGPRLHCNTSEGLLETCRPLLQAVNRSADGLHGGDSEGFYRCISQVLSTPSCSHGAVDEHSRSGDAGSFRQQGEPVSQIPEAFADYMAAQALARVVQEDGARLNVTPQGRLTHRQNLYDGLIAMASDYATLHGVCLNDNSLDDHPAGYLRMNRSVLGNPDFRSAMGCGRIRPRSERGGGTCRGL